LTGSKTRFAGVLYQNIAKPILFLFDPESVHKSFINIGKFLGGNAVTKGITRWVYYYRNPALTQNILGIRFESPVGLSAGFDKDAEIISICEDLGFGFTEVGSVTKLASSGNPGKRLGRLPERKSLWVNLGLNNKGADSISSGLRNESYEIPFGVSIAKTNCRETVNDRIGKEDYLYSLKKFNSRNVGAYYTLNISCPNAYGGQPFSRPAAYEALLKGCDALHIKKPIFVKLSPDLTKKNVNAIIEISKRHKVDGFVISNLTKRHNFGEGGLSGKAVEKHANDMLKYVYRKTKGRFILIGVGGIFSAEDAYRKIQYGANLVELITGMIYQGPNLISEINIGIAELLRMDGFKSIEEAVGSGINKRHLHRHAK